jgi:hypothetical protein
MAHWVSTFGSSQYLQHRGFQLSVSVLIGLAFFAVASWGLHWRVGLQFSGADQPAPTTSASLDSLVPSIPANSVAISTPVFGAQAMMAEVQEGDRMDILALLPARGDTPAHAAVVVRGATVLARPAAQSGAPIVFAVTPEESLVVTHLVQSGVSLTYSLRSTAGAPPAASRG